MKRLVAIIMIGIMTIPSFSVVVSAKNNDTDMIVVYDVGGASKNSFLEISTNTAICKSIFYPGNSVVTKVTAAQTLEKKESAYKYSTVKGTSYTKTSLTGRLSLTNYAYNLSSGTYRLKTVFTVNYKDGKSEAVTVYSNEKTII